MRVLLRFFLAAIFSTTATTPLPAQVCRGGVDFSTSRAQGQAAVELESNSSLYAVSGGLGGTHYFGLALLGVRTYDYREGNTYLLGFGGGRVFHHKLTGRAENCIEVRGDFGTGPDLPGSVRADESSSSLTFELTSGLPFRAGRSLSVTPFVGFAGRWASVVTTFSNGSLSVNDFYELATFGVGISANGILALQPYAQLPLGRDTRTPVFGMRFSMSIGGARE